MPPSETELAALKRWKRQHWVEFALLALERDGTEAVRIVECSLRGGQIERLELTDPAGFPEYGSHDEASIAQRRLQAAGR